jgi:hypothetical protein
LPLHQKTLDSGLCKQIIFANKWKLECNRISLDEKPNI